jgi:hypothetical protein
LDGSAKKGIGALGTKHKWERKSLVFLGVLILHGSVLLLLLRATHQFPTAIKGDAEPLIFLLLHKNGIIETPAPPSAAAAGTLSPKRKRLPAPVAQNNAITLPAAAATPKIDWDDEARWAARNELANAAKEGDYRNLGGLSDAQLKFVRDNHMVPMAPGIVWAHPRVEVDKDTLLPIIHINDHCVLILLFPFCGIGHIRPNTHLLDHMHDPEK